MDEKERLKNKLPKRTKAIKDKNRPGSSNCEEEFICNTPKKRC